MPTPMRSRGTVVDIGDLRYEETGNEPGDVRRQGRRESPPEISGKVILVISGQSRMMYQSLKPEPEGAISSKRSVPQAYYSSPHDAGASMTSWLITNIQGRSKR